MVYFENLLSQMLLWEEISTGSGDFDALTFLSDGKEFGHLHENGFLDIAFGRDFTEQLLNNPAISRHLYVPKTSITFKIKTEQDLPFALKLLRTSFLKNYLKKNQEDSAKINEFNVLTNELLGKYIF